MNTPSNALPDARVGSQAIAPAATPATRPFYWSLRRELWENRSIYMVPLVVAGVFLFGFLVSGNLWHRMHAAAFVLDANGQRQLTAAPYTFAALAIMGTTFIIAIFYCLDALYGERRDRSILFWKSLPVSDLTTVLSKATVPIVIIPLLTFALTVVLQWIMLAFHAAVLLGTGATLAPLSQLPLFQMQLMDLYHLITIHALWYAPIFCWLLLVSAWARRAPFLWAVLPPAVIGILEKLVFGTSYFAAMIRDRFSGGPAGMSFTMDGMTMDPLAHLTPGRFLISPGLWIGLLVATAFLAGAVRLRRYRVPL